MVCISYNYDFTVVLSIQLMGQELQELKQEKQQLQQKCEQQEQALQEMGLHLSQSVLKSLESINFVCVSHYILTFVLCCCNL